MDMKSLGLPEHIFNSFWHHFHVLILKKCGFACVRTSYSGPAGPFQLPHEILEGSKSMYCVNSRWAVRIILTCDVYLCDLQVL
jgi:hypothetical protein